MQIKHKNLQSAQRLHFLNFIISANFEFARELPSDSEIT